MLAVSSRGPRETSIAEQIDMSGFPYTTMMGTSTRMLKITIYLITEYDHFT